MPDLNITRSNQAGHYSAASTDITGTVAVAIIVLLFMVVAFVLFLHLYAKRLWWRGGDQNPVLSNGATAALRLSNGLDQAILKSLPVLVFSVEEFKDGLECSVCLSEVVDGEKARLLPECNHGFHVDCIDMWFQSHSTCPLCRNAVSSPPISSQLKARVIDITNSSLSFEQIPESSSESSSIRNTNERPSAQSLVVDEGPSQMVIIDIPLKNTTEFSPPEDKYGGDEETKAPAVLSRMQTFKRLLSRENKVAACSESSADVELTVSIA